MMPFCENEGLVSVIGNSIENDSLFHAYNRWRDFVIRFGWRSDENICSLKNEMRVLYQARPYRLPFICVPPVNSEIVSIARVGVRYPAFI